MKTDRLLLVSALVLLLPSYAWAETITFSGTGAPSTDPLGGATSVFTISGLPFGFWGEGPANDGGQITFNPAGLDSGFVATGFSFTYTGTQALTYTLTEGFGDSLSKNVPTPPNTGAGSWTSTLNGKTVTFTAPALINDLNPGDLFNISIEFTTAIIPADFSYTATWTGFETPLPASWGMMMLGCLGLGVLGYRQWRQSTALGMTA